MPFARLQGKWQNRTTNENDPFERTSTIIQLQVGSVRDSLIFMYLWEGK